MAYRVTNGTGTSFNTAANWDEGVNTPSIHASTSITVTSGGVTSATFTAPNLVNASTGVVVPVSAVGTGGTIVATLQEDLGAGFADVAGATATITITTLVANTLVFFEFTTPYVFATLTANKYRIKLNTAGATGTTSIAADSGGANFAYLTTMNSNVVPTTGDDIICVSPNQGSALIMDLDTSPSIGSGTNTSVPVFRSWGNAITVANAGGIAWQTGTSRTVTCKGNVCIQSGGYFRMGTTGTKVQIGVLARLQFDQNGTTTNYGLVHFTGGLTSIQGTALTFRKTTLSSGVGTAASPFVSADSVDWSVNDELVFVPVSNNATNYDETETRFIKTKNSATSYVLSATVGGAESALTNSHTSGAVFNLTRPCLIDTTNTSHAWYGDFQEVTSVSNVDIDGCRFETYGSTTTSKTTITFSNLATELFTLDDCVFYRGQGSSGVLLGSNNDERTFTWLIQYDCNTTASNNGAFILNSFRNKTFQNCYAIDSQIAGFLANASASTSFVNCGVWASGRSSATANRGFQFANTSGIYMDGCDAHANRTHGILLASASGECYDSNFGTVGQNQTTDVGAGIDSFNEFLFANCNFGSSALISNYTSQSEGSEIKFDKINGTSNNHKWYTPFGIAQATGAGLSDTNVRTAGTLNVRIAPENSTTGFYWDFKILANPTSAVAITGFIQKNAAFGTDTCTVDLYLPGLTPGVDTPSDTETMPNNTSYNVFNLAANYTGSIPLYATVRVTAKTTTASAYVYVADLYNGTNEITNLKTWDKGKPSEIIFEQLGDADAVWAVQTSILTTTGTTGYLLTKLLTLGKFLGLK